MPLRRRPNTVTSWIVTVLLASAAGGEPVAPTWTLPEITLPAPAAHPLIACTPAELERLRAAYRGGGPEHDVVANRVRAAEAQLGAPVDYPPRGGQHNQWYQCEPCQMGLETVDAAHHRCPKCGTVYSGPPYDDVLFSRVHGGNLGRAHTAAWAYAITGERRFADDAAGILLGYAERYLAYPYHNASLGSGGTGGGHILEQSLSEASLCAAHIAPAFDLIRDALSADDRNAIVDGLIVPLLENLDRHKCGQGNWQTWHNAAMILAGAAIGDVSWVRRALVQPGNGFVHQLEVSVSADGMWYENSWGYHFYTLMAMVHIVEAARRCGIDLWSHPGLKSMFTLPLEYTMADGSLPRFGDDVGSAAKRPGVMEPAYHTYRDPAFLPLLPDEPTWDTIVYGRPTGAAREPVQVPRTGRVFRDSGHAILRSDGPAGLTAALTFSPFGGFHGHFDKLSFVLFGYGTELGVDPGRAKSQAYRLPIHGQWYRATVSHNTVVVDGVSQQPAAGRLLAFGANARYAGVVAGCTEGYPGVAHRRLLLLAPAYALVFDELAADHERRFDWLYHHRGNGVRSPDAQEAAELPEDLVGAVYIDDVSGGVSDGTVRIAFTGAAVDCHLTLAGGSETGVTLGTGPGSSVLDRVPLALLSRRGKDVVFAAVLEPRPAGERPAITSVSHSRKGDRHTIRIARGNRVDTVHLARDHAFEVRSGGKVVLVGRAEPAR